MKSMSQKVEQQKNYLYRDSYRWVLATLVVMIALSAVLAGAVSYMAIFRDQPKYYASMTTGQVVPLRALDEPVVTNQYVLEWASLATRKAFNLDFVNYKKQLEDASVYFTSSGWKAFLKALDDSGLLPIVQEKKLLMNAIASGSPVILYNGIVNGRYTWRMQLPLLVTFGSASEQRQVSLVISLIVSRVSVLDTSQGILVTGFEANLK